MKKARTSLAKLAYTESEREGQRGRERDIETERHGERQMKVDLFCVQIEEGGWVTDSRCLGVARRR